jgi:hypothetical protein
LPSSQFSLANAATNDRIRRGATVLQTLQRFFLSPFFFQGKTRKPICIM